MRWLGIAVIGFLGGVTSGLFGVGGGVVFVPLLMIFFGFNPHLAIGSSLVAIVPTAVVGAFRHFSSGRVDWKVALALVCFAMAGAWLGAGISLRMDVALLRKFYAVFLFVVAFRLLAKS